MRVSSTTRRWILAVTLLTAAQAFLLHWGVVQIGAVRTPPPARTQFSMVLGEASQLRLDSMSWLLSPVLFALPSLHGFSGDAWLKYRSLSLPQTLVQDNTSWLELETNQLGRTLAEFAASNRPPTLQMADRPVVWRDNFPADPAPEVGRSRLIVEGPVSKRRLLTAVDLPSWPFADLLPDTEVSAWVDGDGRVFSAVLSESEGKTASAVLAAASRLPEADRFALQFAKLCRFEPVRRFQPVAALAESRELEAARLVFRWHVVPLSVTNKTVYP